MQAHLRRKELSRHPPGPDARTHSIFPRVHPAADPENWEADHPTPTRNIFGLTFRQELFCAYCMVTNNVTTAYQDAYGGSIRNANVNGHRLARQRNIKLWRRRLKLQFLLSSFFYSDEDFLSALDELASVEAAGAEYFNRMKSRWSAAATGRERDKRTAALQCPPGKLTSK